MNVGAMRMLLMVALPMIVVSFGLIASGYAILGPGVSGTEIADWLGLLIGMQMAAACIIVASAHGMKSAVAASME